jgi:hypothetical protein
MSPFTCAEFARLDQFGGQMVLTKGGFLLTYGFPTALLQPRVLLIVI